MNIWKLSFDFKKYDWLITKVPYSFDEIHSFDGRSLKDTWKKREYIKLEPVKNLPLCDAPGFDRLVFSKKMIEKSKALIGSYVEFLPIECKYGSYSIVNPTTVLDAIDYENSKFIRFNSSNRIMRFIKYSFKKETVKGYPIFKIVDEPTSYVFVNDEFKKMIEENGFTGLLFEEVWSDDTECEKNLSCSLNCNTVKTNTTDLEKRKTKRKDKFLKELVEKSKSDKEKSTNSMYLYTKKELNEYEKYVKEQFGDFKEVFHEIASPDVHLDVLLIEPTKEKPYYMLVTEGAGAYKQNVPREYSKYDMDYAEYIIYLPPAWNIKSNESRFYWPIGELKKIARLPINTNSWLATGHTIHSNEAMTSVDASTEQNSFILVGEVDKEGRSAVLKMKSGKHINFYILMPLYQEELEFEMTNGWDAFVKKVPDDYLPPVINPTRERFC